MKEIPVKECINLGSIIRKYGLEQYTMVNMEIGSISVSAPFPRGRYSSRFQGKRNMYLTMGPCVR